MTEKEMTMIVSIAYMNFENLFKNFQKDADKRALIKDWYRLFKDYDYQVVQYALDYLINNVKIENIQMFNQADLKSEIKNKIIKLTTQEQMSEAEAMNLIRKASRNSARHSQEEFEELPPLLQKLVGSPKELKEYALMDSDRFNAVVISNLTKGYRIMLKREQERVALPNNVREAIESKSILRIGESFIKIGE